MNGIWMDGSSVSGVRDNAREVRSTVSVSVSVSVSVPVSVSVSVLTSCLAGLLDCYGVLYQTAVDSFIHPNPAFRKHSTEYCSRMCKYVLRSTSMRFVVCIPSTVDCSYSCTLRAIMIHHPFIPLSGGYRRWGRGDYIMVLCRSGRYTECRNGDTQHYRPTSRSWSLGSEIISQRLCKAA